MPISEETRKKMSDSARLRCTDEWRRTKSSQMETKLPGDELAALYGSGMTQNELADYYCVSQKVIWGFMRRHDIKARPAVKRNQWGEKNHMWKGDAASYKAMHHRLYRMFGKPKRCEYCGTTDARRSYDWANLTGDFSDSSDYRRLCRSCHWKLDRKILNIKHMRSARDGV